jgi:hypothetical protein
MSEVGTGVFGGGTGTFAGSASGTGLGVNMAPGFGGNSLDLQQDGVSKLSVDGGGSMMVAGTATFSAATVDLGNSNGNFRCTTGAGSTYGFTFFGQANRNLIFSYPQSPATYEWIWNDFPSNTITISGSYAVQRGTRFQAPTITAASALTVTDAATVSVEGAPIAAGSAIITRSYQQWWKGTDKLRIDTTTATTIGAAGAAAAMPVPLGYLPIYVGSTLVKLAYFNP